MSMETMNYKQYSGPINALGAALAGTALLYAQTNLMSGLELLILFPFITLRVSDGRLWTLLSYLLMIPGSIWVLGKHASVATVASVLLPIAVVSFALGEMVARKSKLWVEWLVGGVLAALMSVAAIAILAYSQNTTPIELMRNTLETIISSMLAELQSENAFGMIHPMVRSLSAQVLTTRVLELMPMVYFLMGLAMSLVNLAVSHFILRKTGEKAEPFALYRLQLPRAAGFVLMALVVAGFACQKMNVPYGNMIAMNVNFSVLAILFVNGLGVISAMFYRRMNPALGFFLFLLIMIYLNAWFIAVVFGAVDLFADIRKRLLTTRGGAE